MKQNKTTWFTSDTHFGHSRILEHCPDRAMIFDDIQNHDKELIECWNLVVKPEDTVYHLGDFAFRNSKKGMKETLEQLNGKVILIRGNHDHSKNLNIFESVYNFAHIKLNGMKILLVHNPDEVEKFNNFPDIDLMLCGHIHEEWTYHLSKHDILRYRHDKNPIVLRTIKLNFPIINVGVDLNNFAPIPIEVIQQRFNNFRKE